MIAYKLHGANYQGVTLLQSPFRVQRDETLELYLKHPSNDNILHQLRIKAGIPSTVNGMPGWGPSIGQYLGAYAKWYCNTKDQRVWKKCMNLFHGWCECARRCDHVLNMGTYPYEKMLGGMLDMYEYMGVEEVRPWLLQITRHAESNFIKSIPRTGFQDGDLKGQIEWYTLPENLYRAYQIFGDEIYRDMATEWLYSYMWDKLAKDIFDIGPRHAYSQVNSLSSAARAYIVTGNDHYLNVICHAYEVITRDHTYATGGYGPAETMFGLDEGYMGNALLSSWDNYFKNGEGVVYLNFGGGHVGRSDAWGSCEVSCCSWAVFKLCDYLIKLTGDARYGNWAEKLLINGTLGQPPITEKGQVLYYASYFVDGAIKSYEDRRLQHMGQNFVWQCCTGTFPQDVAEYSNMIAYFDDQGVYVSQLIPAKIDFMQNGYSISLISHGDFPRKPEARFTVRSDTPVRFQLRVRIPAWANCGNRVTVNGEALDIAIIPDTWMTVEREWRNDDEIELTLPYKLSFKPVDARHADVVALCYGPLVLVCEEMTVLVGDVDRPEEWIKRVEGEDNVFETMPGHSGIYDFICRRFVPYYQVGLMQWYYMYNRIFPDMETLDKQHQGF